MREFFDYIEECDELSLQASKKIIGKIACKISNPQEYIISITKEKIYSYRLHNWYYEVYTVYIQDENDNLKIFCFDKKGNFFYEGWLSPSVFTCDEEQDL